VIDGHWAVNQADGDLGAAAQTLHEKIEFHQPNWARRQVGTSDQFRPHRRRKAGTSLGEANPLSCA